MIHIVSFDIPYPADYGGVIDVYSKLKALNSLGVKVILHAFVYGNRKPSEELLQYCEKVHYYPRSMGLTRILSTKPYIINSRCSKELLKNILKVKVPVVLEGWHSCCHLSALKNAGFKVLVREHNLEWKYYRGLASNTTYLSKKIYYLLESYRLKQFETKLYQADHIMCISSQDVEYHLKNGYEGACYLPVFHNFLPVPAATGIGKFALYHGNLSVEENSAAVKWLLEEVWNELHYPLVIAGLGSPDWLRSMINHCKGVTLMEDANKMESFIRDAHIHVLPAMQETGIKLKLLHALYAGRHCLVNMGMINGTGLLSTCILAESPQEWQAKIRELIMVPYTDEDQKNRSVLLAALFDNEENAGRLMTWSCLPPS